MATRKQALQPSASGAPPADLWKKLLRPAPVLTMLSAAELVAELNRRFEADACYRPDSRFVLVDSLEPGGPPRGASWQGPASMKPVMLRVVSSSRTEFASDAPFFADP